jgi:diacylglycerol kinase family enzyme
VNALLIINQNAGCLRKPYLPGLRDALIRFGFQPEIIEASDPCQTLLSVNRALATNPARRFHRIIIAGGDGTINSVLPALAQTPEQVHLEEIPLAILPAG